MCWEGITEMLDETAEPSNVPFLRDFITVKIILTDSNNQCSQHETAKVLQKIVLEHEL